jgi:hypothetical protein
MDETNRYPAPNGIPILKAADPEAEAAERREREKRAYQGEVEQRRHEFEAFMEKRKAKRDWVAIVLAACAAIFAGWTAFDAHKSLNYQTALVSTQEKSVNAQIKAMQLAEQPFVYPKIEDWHIGKTVDGPQVQIGYQPVVSGKTPALNIREVIRCDLYPWPLDRDLMSIPAPELGIGLSSRPLSESLGCGDPNSPLIKSRRFTIHLYGQYQYEDLFGETHHTPFCFTGGGLIVRKHWALFGCPGKFNVKVD